MPERDESHAYVVRWGPRLLTLPIALLAVVAVLLAFAWPPGPLASSWVAVLLALDGAMWVRAVRGIVNRTVMFAVDSRGVYLGEGDGGTPPERVPWPEIDALVRYRRWTRTADGQATTQWYVGIVRGGRIAADRRVQGWTIDVDRLTAAVKHLGAGRSVEWAPDQGNTSDAGGSYEAYTALPPDRHDPDAYVVRWGVRSLLFPVLVLGVVVVVLLLAWPPGVTVWAIVAAFLVADVLLWVRTVPRLMDRSVEFAVDSRGVYFGPDDDVRTPEWVPWTGIDAVVRYRRWTRSSDSRPAAQWHVGILRGGRIVAGRRVQGWQLDVDRLTAATRRYGNGTPVEHLPDQGVDPNGIRILSTDI